MQNPAGDLSHSLSVLGGNWDVVHEHFKRHVVRMAPLFVGLRSDLKSLTSIDQGYCGIALHLPIMVD